MDPVLNTPESGETSIGSKCAAAIISRHPTIPNEILLEIFSYIRLSIETDLSERRYVLLQLSLACRSFCTALRPHLFHQLVLDGQASSPSWAFCRALSSGDMHARALAAHIRNCRISRLPRRGPKSWAAIAMYHQALCWATDTESLQLFHFHVDTEFWSAIRTLSKLKTLETLLAGGPIGTLKTLTLSQCGHSSVSMWSLIDILSKVPSVRNLTILSGIIDGPKVTPEDFATLLPDLRSLTCWLPLVAVLTPGRPLVKLSILGRGTLPLDLDVIMGTRAPYTTITALIIPSTISLAAGHFTRLRKLVVELPPPCMSLLDIPILEATAELTKLIVDTYEEWPVHTSVQELRMTVETKFSLLDLALQHTILTGSLSHKFPALRWFQLGKDIEWERFADEAWRVFIPAEAQTEIVAGFYTKNLHVVDHDGYLQRLSVNARNLP